MAAAAGCCHCWGAWGLGLQCWGGGGGGAGSGHPARANSSKVDMNLA